MVGDSEVDAAAAEAAGIPMVLMTYGYRRGPAEGIRCRAALDRFDELTVLFRDTWSAPPAGRGG
jgi:phosphoglycolate phosphatase